MTRYICNNCLACLEQYKYEFEYRNTRKMWIGFRNCIKKNSPFKDTCINDFINFITKHEYRNQPERLSEKTSKDDAIV